MYRALLFFIISAQALCAQVIFSDGFTDVDGTALENHGTSWIKSGTPDVRIYGNSAHAWNKGGSFPNQSYYWVDVDDWDMYKLSMLFADTSTSALNEAGFVLRRAGLTMYYAVYVISAGTLYIKRIDSSTLANTLSSSSFAFSHSITYRLEVSVTTDSIIASLYDNSTNSLVTTTSAYTIDYHGQFGLYLFGDATQDVYVDTLWCTKIGNTLSFVSVPGSPGLRSLAKYYWSGTLYGGAYDTKASSMPNFSNISTIPAFSQSNSANQATFRQAPHAGDTPALEFDGVDDFYTNTTKFDFLHDGTTFASGYAGIMAVVRIETITTSARSYQTIYDDCGYTSANVGISLVLRDRTSTNWYDGAAHGFVTRSVSSQWVFNAHTLRNGVQTGHRLLITLLLGGARRDTSAVLSKHLTLRVNGIQVATVPVYRGNGFSASTSTYDPRIGWTGDSGSDAFEGYLYAIAIFDSVKTMREIKEMELDMMYQHKVPMRSRIKQVLSRQEAFLDPHVLYATQDPTGSLDAPVFDDLSGTPGDSLGGNSLDVGDIWLHEYSSQPPAGDYYEYETTTTFQYSARNLDSSIPHNYMVTEFLPKSPDYSALASVVWDINDPSGGTGNAGIVFKYLDINNFWKLWLNKDLGTITLAKFVNGQQSTVWNYVMPSENIGANQHYQIWALVSSDTIRAYVGDLRYGTEVVDDTNVGVFSAGFWLQNTSSRCSWFAVHSASAPAKPDTSSLHRGKLLNNQFTKVIAQ